MLWWSSSGRSFPNSSLLILILFCGCCKGHCCMSYFYHPSSPSSSHPLVPTADLRLVAYVVVHRPKPSSQPDENVARSPQRPTASPQDRPLSASLQFYGMDISQ
ncbi:hypothetical protein QTP88_008695 [Uroleucon formosanum]